MPSFVIVQPFHSVGSHTKFKLARGSPFTFEQFSQRSAMRPINYKDNALFGGFSWHTDERKILSEAKPIVAQAAHSRQCAAEFQNVLWLDDGVYLPWKKPAKYELGYLWFLRLIGELAHEKGNSSRWLVVGHKGGFDPQTVLAKREERKPKEKEALGGEEKILAAAGVVGKAASESHSLSGPSLAAPAPAAACAGDASAPVFPERNACPMLKLCAGRELLENGWEHYILEGKLGEGTFGEVFRARLGAQTFAAKRLRTTNQRSNRYAAMREAYFLDRCQGHPHVIQLFDVSADPADKNSFIFLFEEWGQDLDRWLRASEKPFGSRAVRGLLSDVVSGLRHLHEALGVMHADLKPANVLVQARGASSGDAQSFWAKLADLGSALSADPQQREEMLPEPTSGDESSPEKCGIEVQTLWFRSPEILFGDQEFGAAADLWSLGVLMAECAGCTFARVSKGTTFSQHGYMVAIFSQLGTPKGPLDATKMPFMPVKPPRFPRQPWPDHVRALLGARGEAFLDKLLQWDPRLRPSIQELAADPYLHAEAFPLGGFLEPFPGAGPAESKDSGNVKFAGGRHDWNIRIALLAPEVLSWLRADPALDVHSAEFAALRVRLSGDVAKNERIEENRKLLIAGALNESCSRNMCGLSTKDVLPLRRVCAFQRAFRAVNEDALSQTTALARAHLARLGRDEQGENGRHFMEASVAEWFLSSGELHFTNGNDGALGFWHEPTHNDGAASILMAGMTLYGRRNLRASQGDGLPDVWLLQEPGTFWFGLLTGPQHQVIHTKAASSELLRVPGVGELSVSIMMRTSLFPYNRARQRDTTPNPREVFESLAETFRQGLEGQPWRLPTLKDCLACAAELEAAESSKKRRTT